VEWNCETLAPNSVESEIGTNVKCRFSFYRLLSIIPQNVSDVPSPFISFKNPNINPPWPFAKSPYACCPKWSLYTSPYFFEKLWKVKWFSLPAIANCGRVPANGNWIGLRNNLIVTTNIDIPDNCSHVTLPGISLSRLKNARAFLYAKLNPDIKQVSPYNVP